MIEREKETDRQTETERQTERQRDKETERDRETERERQRGGRVTKVKSYYLSRVNEFILVERNSV